MIAKQPISFQREEGGVVSHSPVEGKPFSIGIVPSGVEKWDFRALGKGEQEWARDIYCT